MGAFFFIYPNRGALLASASLRIRHFFFDTFIVYEHFMIALHSFLFRSSGSQNEILCLREKIWSLKMEYS